VDYETPPAYPPPSDQPEPRVSRARERRKKRQERTAMVRPRLPDGYRPQLTPAGGFKLPDIQIPQSRYILYGVGALVVVLGVLYVLGQITGSAQVVTTPPNGLWLGTELTYGLDEDTTVEELVTQLREHQIGTVYAWVSWLKEDMTWGGWRDGTDEFTEMQPTVMAFVEEFKRLYPESILYGWVSLPANIHDMSQPEVRSAVAEFSDRVIDEMKFDGVFLNIEPVWNNDTSFLTLLGQVREAVGPNTLISAAIPPDWSPLGADIPVPPLIQPGTAWDERYKQSVALLVDELAVMAYNSGLSSAADYSEWVAYQVETYANAVAALDTGAGSGAHVMVGIPTYAAEPPGHDPRVENVASAAQGIRLGLQQAGDNAEYVRGAAIYAAWETDSAEWNQFRQSWSSLR
jgi:hypothetical protein